LPGRTFVAMATFRQKEIGSVLSFPAMATLYGSGDILPGRILLP
jgi:hypothetical protein